MTLNEIESALHRARCEVFNDDDAVAEAAAQEITRLRKLLKQHPDEVARKNKLARARDEALLRRWA